MNRRLAALCAATFAAAIGITLPTSSHAGNVGYYLNCFGEAGNPSAAIVAAGHTPVPIATLDAVSLAPLQALIIESCSVLPQSSALDVRIFNGMGLFYDVIPNDTNTPPIPGMSGIQITLHGCGNDVQPAAGSPVTTGVGGTITSTSLDGTNLCSYRGTASQPSIPSGTGPVGFPFLTTNSSSDVIGFGYTEGQSRIAFSMSQFFAALPGGSYSSDSLAPGAMTYYTNVIAWITKNPPPVTTTCASEGYTGTKLTWCKNICEKGYTGATLDTWIHRWVSRYRDLPYCALEGGEGEPELPPLG